MTLTVKQAIEQGYTKYAFSKDGFQSLLDLEQVPQRHFEREDIVLVSKESYHPSTDEDTLSEVVADAVWNQHESDSGDDTDSVYDTVKAVDFTEITAAINKALSALNYYRLTDIKLIP